MLLTIQEFQFTVDLLKRASAAGIVLRLTSDGTVEYLKAESAPPELIADLKNNESRIVELFTAGHCAGDCLPS